jgi:hypothetical protein
VNERIKELLARPGLERLNDWVNVGPVQRAALEEFAELIVQECTKHIETAAYYDPCEDWGYGYNTGLASAKELIAIHFGMEP